MSTLTGLRAILFDAVGTLIHPEPSAGAAYALYGQRFGSRLEGSVIRRRFAEAFAAEETYDATQAHRTDERRELERWQRIVRCVLDDVSEVQTCFDALYQHFAKPTAWRIEPGAGDLLRQLQQRGYLVGLASNFDHRLREVIAGLAGLPPMTHLFISSEVGWKKPAVQFFDCACRAIELPPQQVLMVGDDVENDVEGATRAGMRALLLDPTHASGDADRLVRLEDLLTRLPG
ncbi:MAG: HAD-IA family hydrolase [Gemmataceae bacterium]